MALPTVNNLTDRIRRAVGDYPQVDVLASQVSNTGTTILLSTTASVKLGVPIVMEQELIMPLTGTTLVITCVRGWHGTTGATHASATPILQNPRFGPGTILDALSEAHRMLWPHWFQWVEDEATVVSDQTQADYALPSAFGESGIVTDIEVLYPGLGNYGWTNYRWWKHREGTTAATGSSTTGRTIQFVRVPPVGTYIRMVGLAPFTGDLTAGGTLSTSVLDSAVPALVMYSCHYLMAQAEAKRLGNATAANVGPNASQPGNNQANSQFHLQRFENYCQNHAQRYPRWRTRRVV